MKHIFLILALTFTFAGFAFGECASAAVGEATNAVAHLAAQQGRVDAVGHLDILMHQVRAHGLFVGHRLRVLQGPNRVPVTELVGQPGRQGRRQGGLRQLTIDVILCH